MSHGYKAFVGENCDESSGFGEDDVSYGVIETVLADWFFGSEVIGLSISLSEILRIEEVVPTQMIGVLLMSLSEGANFQDTLNYTLGRLKILATEATNFQESLSTQIGGLLLSLSETVNIQDFFYLVNGELMSWGNLIVLAKDHGYESSDGLYTANAAIQVLTGYGYNVRETYNIFDLSLGDISIIVPAND